MQWSSVVWNGHSPSIASSDQRRAIASLVTSLPWRLTHSYVLLRCSFARWPSVTWLWKAEVVIRQCLATFVVAWQRGLPQLSYLFHWISRMEINFETAELVSVLITGCAFYCLEMWADYGHRCGMSSRNKSVAMICAIRPYLKIANGHSLSSQTIRRSLVV